MSRHISDERLAVIHLQLSGAIIKNPGVWIHDHRGNAICEAHDVIAALDELKRRRQSPGTHGAKRLGHTTKVLMSMKVGEEVEIEPVTQGALTTCRRTARRHMGVEDASWHTRTQDNGLVKITRMPNGTPDHAKYHNPAVYTMAAMRVGQVVILDTVVGKMHNGIKVHARKIMDNSEAQWRCTNLANGKIQCTRMK